MHLLWPLLIIHLCLHSITTCGNAWICLNSLKKCYFISVTFTNLDGAISGCRNRNSSLISLDEVRNISQFLGILIRNSNVSNYWIGDGDVNTTGPELTDKRGCYVVNNEGVEMSACDGINGYICQRDGYKAEYELYDACIQRENLTCYWITRAKEQFIEANNHCSDEDGHLVHVYDRKEEDFIYSLISLNYENNGAKYWLDWNKEGKWINNTFNLSKDSSTLSDDESCSVLLFNKSNFLKISVKCNSFAHAVCQKNITSYLFQPSSNCLSCPISWFSYGSTDMCYWISNNKQTRNWQDARNYCRNFGGDLITYTNKAEEQFILSHLLEKSEDYWLGVKYSFSRYKWTEERRDDETWIRRNFKKFNGTEGWGKNVCVFYSQKAKEWLHGECELSKGFICKGGKRICDKEWKLFKGNCYKIESSLAFTWHRALMYCKDNNGSLSSIHSTEELQFLSRMVNETNSNALFWIGLYHIGDYIQWSDSSPIQFLLNDLPYLKFADEKCATINFTGKWFIHNCNTKRGFICKKIVNSNVVLPTTILTPLEEEEEECPKFWLHFGNKCYLYVKDNNKSLSWREANRECSSLGSYLAAIQNSKEQEFLTFLLVYFEKTAWIGFNSLENNLTFTWIDNSSVEYTNWNEDQITSLQTKRCVEMLAPESKQEFTAGKWNPATCDRSLSYFCQKKIDSTRPTSSRTLQILQKCNKAGDWIKFKNRCYKMLNWSNSWLKADLQCRKFNAHLVTISNSSFNIFVQFIMSSYNVRTIWLGLNRKKRFRYKWISEWPVLFTNWGKDQPGKEGSCSIMLPSGQWMTKPCLESYPFICETITDLQPSKSDKFGSCFSKSARWIDLGKKCYYFEGKALLSLPEAKLECLRKESELISLHSVEEVNIVSKYIKNTTTSYWIGLVRRQDGSFSWTDYTPVNFVYWDDNEPADNYRDNCVEMHRRLRTWNVADCALKRGYICAKEKKGIGGREQKRIHAKEKLVQTKTLQPGIIVTITVVCIVVIILKIYLIITCIKKIRKKESPIITDSNEETMTYSNVVFVEDDADNSCDINNKNPFCAI